MVVVDLEDQTREILEFEKLQWKYAGSKDEAIRTRFGLSATNYSQLLNRVIDLPAALEFAPTVVSRLRAQRAHVRRAGEGKK